MTLPPGYIDCSTVSGGRRASSEALETRAAEVEDARARKQATHLYRTGARQLVQLTRGMENGKCPVVLEPPSKRGWVPAPPHLTSHWATISGHLLDPPPRAGGSLEPRTYGRKSFPEPPHDSQPRRPGSVIWGGSRAEL